MVCEAVFLGKALIVALPIGCTDLFAQALAVPGASLLLAHIVRAIALHAALTARAIARRLASLMALRKGANEGALALAAQAASLSYRELRFFIGTPNPNDGRESRYACCRENVPQR